MKRLIFVVVGIVLMLSGCDGIKTIEDYNCKKVHNLVEGQLFINYRFNTVDGIVKEGVSKFDTLIKVQRDNPKCDIHTINYNKKDVRMFSFQFFVPCNLYSTKCSVK